MGAILIASRLDVDAKTLTCQKCNSLKPKRKPSPDLSRLSAQQSPSTQQSSAASPAVGSSRTAGIPPPRGSPRLPQPRSAPADTGMVRATACPLPSTSFQCRCHGKWLCRAGPVHEGETFFSWSQRGGRGARLNVGPDVSCLRCQHCNMVVHPSRLHAGEGHPPWLVLHEHQLQCRSNPTLQAKVLHCDRRRQLGKHILRPASASVHLPGPERVCQDGVSVATTTPGASRDLGYTQDSTISSWKSFFGTPGDPVAVPRPRDV